MNAIAGPALAGRPSYNAARHRRAFIPVFGVLIAFAWLALWLWGRSPYGRYLDHGDWLSPDNPAALICRSVPGNPVAVLIVLHALSWVLMTLAMMLPTTLPLFAAFDRVTAQRADHARLLALLGCGYLFVWAAFGLLAHPLDGALIALIDRIPLLAVEPWLVGAGIIALAGAFQFSDLKYRCLEQCRSPLSFIVQHWRGRAVARHAFLLGVHHAVFCVGCCWALMLLMFVVGSGSLGWMLVLGGVMAIEKNAPWGRRLSAPLGTALLAWAALLVVLHA